MGWVYYDAPPRSIATKIADLCSFENADVRLSPVALAKVLEPDQVGPVWYAAVRRELLSDEAVFRAVPGKPKLALGLCGHEASQSSKR